MTAEQEKELDHLLERAGFAVHEFSTDATPEDNWYEIYEAMCDKEGEILH